MEPEDNRHIFSRQAKHTKQFSSESSDNYWQSVQEIQTCRRRRKRAAIMAEEHHCSPSSLSMSLGKTLFSSTSTSSYSLVVFLFTSALLLLVCISPSQSLPFDGRSLSSSSNYRSQVDLMIDPVHQAEFGDDDSLENTRVVKSVFDMVLRTPVPPTRCPPGTQSPFDGTGPCIKRNMGPVALVDESFLLDTLRGLAKEGVLLGGGPQKTRRPGGGGSGNNRRRTSGRPGSRTTTSTTTTESPPTTIESSDEGEMSPTTTFSSTTGDNVNVAEEDVVVAAITEEPTVETTPSAGNEEAAKPDDKAVNEAASLSLSSEQLAASSDKVAPETEIVTDSEATTNAEPTITSTEPSHLKNGVDLRRTAVPDTEERQVPSSSSSETGNDEPILLVAAATTTPTTLTETPTTTTTSAAVTLADEEQIVAKQVKSGQDQREQVPIIVTTTSSTSIPDQQNQWSSESDANNNATGTFVIVNPVNEAIIMQHSNQDDHSNVQVSLESEQESSHNDPISLELTTPSATLSFEVTSTQPTFPKEEFLLKTVDMISQTDPNNNHRVTEEERVNTTTDSFMSSKIFEAVTASSPASPHESDEKMMTTVNPIPGGAENHVLTGVISTTDHPHLHQKENAHVDPMSQMAHDSVAQSPEIPTWHPEMEEKEGALSAKMMTTRMMKVTNGETLQDEQQDEFINEDEGSHTFYPSIKHTSETPQELKESQLSVTTVHGQEPEQINQDRSPTASTLPLAEQGNLKELHVIVPQVETTSETIPTEKAFGLLGSLDIKTETESIFLPTQSSVVVQEQHPREQEQEKDEAGDISMTSRAGEDEQAKGINEAEIEQGDDGQIYADKSSIVNHVKDEGDKEKEAVTLQVGDSDLTIINGNLPSEPTSVSPVHDNPKMPVEDTAVPEVNGKEESFVEKELSSREQQQQYNGVVSREVDQLAFTGVPEEHTLVTTLVPPSPTTTNAPSASHPLHKFQPGDTLLQFQLPIVTRSPDAALTENKESNNEAESFQDFPEFPPVGGGTGKVRFPNSAEEDRESVNLQETYKPIFVQDFQIDYPPKQKELSVPHVQQQWQIPRSFQSAEIINSTLQHQPPSQHPPLQEYYDSGSTEYLESELDRMHQKTRSRNRFRTREPAVPSTTNPPLLPPELSLLSPQQSPSFPAQQLQQHHHQPSVYFARRNPSADLIPFGYLNFRTGHERFHHNNRRLVW